MAEQTRYMVMGTTAFDAVTPTRHAAPDGGKSGLTLKEMPHIGKISLRGSADVLDALCRLAGLTRPEAANSITTNGERHALWMGPDELMLLVEAGAEAQLITSMQSAMKDAHCAIVDVTDALCAISLKGSHVRDILAKGCPLDLHANSFIAGTCAQSFLSHAGVTLACLDTDNFILIGRTSFTAYITSFLADAALEYGFDM